MEQKKQREMMQIQMQMQEMQPIILVICRENVVKARYRCVRSNTWIYAKLFSGTTNFPEYLQIRRVNVTLTPFVFHYDNCKYTSHIFLMGLGKDKLEFDDTIFPLHSCLINSLNTALSIKFSEDDTHIFLDANEYAKLDNHDWIRIFVHSEIRRLKELGKDVSMS